MLGGSEDARRNRVPPPLWEGVRRKVFAYRGPADLEDASDLEDAQALLSVEPADFSVAREVTVAGRGRDRLFCRGSASGARTVSGEVPRAREVLEPPANTRQVTDEDLGGCGGGAFRPAVTGGISDLESTRRPLCDRTGALGRAIPSHDLDAGVTSEPRRDRGRRPIWQEVDRSSLFQIDEDRAPRAPLLPCPPPPLAGGRRRRAHEG